MDSHTLKMSSNIFTASQIARALGKWRQAARSMLDGISPSGQIVVNGNLADAWAFEVLPIDVQCEIARTAIERGFLNGEQFLTALREPWKASVPWNEVAEKYRVKAVKLQAAMARPLMMHSNGIAGAELDSAGMEDFQKTFGYSLKDARSWRWLLSRTVERDGGQFQWGRLEIYLDDRAFKKRAPVRKVTGQRFTHDAIGDFIQSLTNRAEPTAEDRAFLWHTAFRHYEELTAQSGERARPGIKRSILNYLMGAFPAGTLCASIKSLRNRFDEKFKAWQSGERCVEALMDNRALNSGNFRKPDFSADEKKIRNLSIRLDGNEALAHRMLRERGELSKAFCDYYDFNPRQNKSYVPDTVRHAITAQVEMTLPLRRGPWEAKMRGPYIPRNWDAVKPGDWFCADDVTLNHYYKYRDENGQWRLTRGECLLMTDLKTGYPLDFLLISGKYNGEHIRSLTLQVHDAVGLPRIGFYFERGVWASKLVSGDKRDGNPLHRRETENGLCSFGLCIRHATTPRAKPIEGLILILQNRMRCIPGFVGFNERTDEREREQALIARANRGDEAALSHFLTQSEWRTKIAEVLAEFKNDPSNGKMIGGKSPAEAWAEEIKHHGLKQLPREARYILSTHVRKVTVRQEGIILAIRGKRRLYCNEETGKAFVQGNQLLAYFNIEAPELLTVSDLDRQNYFSVKEIELPAMTATREQLEEVNRARKGHMAPAAAIFGEIRHEMISTISRDNEQSEDVKALGRFHNAAVETAKAEKSERGKTLKKLQVKAAAAGVELGEVRNPDEALEAIDRLEHFRQRMLEKEAKEAGL
jgi:hypothetical protein